MTSGPTIEPIDPVRYIANRSSGKQGHAIAAALADMGAQVTLVSGPTQEADPDGITVVKVETAAQMLKAVRAALPCDIAVCAAAVADWHVADVSKIKLKKSTAPPRINLAPNPDIMATLAQPRKQRPSLVIGFAAETSDVIEKAKIKRAEKNCDWIVANDVSPGSGTFGSENNTVHVITAEGVQNWPTMTKREVAEKLADLVATFAAKKL